MKKNEETSKKDLTPEECEGGWRELPGLEAQLWVMPRTTILACGNCEHSLCKKCKRLVFKTRSPDAPAKKDLINSVFADMVNRQLSVCSIDCKFAPAFGVYKKLPAEWNTPMRCCQCNSVNTLESWLLGKLPKELFAGDHTRCKEKWHPLSEKERKELILENDLDLGNGRITTQEHAEAMPQEFNGKWYGPEDLAAIQEEEMAKLAK